MTTNTITSSTMAAGTIAEGDAWAADWYQLPTDPAGTLRWFDGQAWTEHTSAGTAQPVATMWSSVAATPATPAAPATPELPPAVDLRAAVSGIATSVRTSPVGEKVAEGAAPAVTAVRTATPAVRLGLAAVALLVLLGGVVTARQLGASLQPEANLQPMQAIDALPSAAQVSAATGRSFGPAERDTHLSPLTGGAGDCTLGSNLVPVRPQGQANQHLEHGSATVDESVLVFATADDAQRMVTFFGTYLDRNRSCVTAGAAAGGATADVTDHDLLVTTARQGSGATVAASGNAVVIVTIADEAGPVSHDQLDALRADALDAARHPDPTRA